MLPLRLLPTTPATAEKMRWLLPFAAILLAFFIGSIILLALRQNPLAVYYVFFIEPFSSLYSIAEVANKTTTLAVIALGLSVCFRSNIWNIGAEGQLTIGAIAATVVALYAGDTPGVLLWMILAAGLAGGLWGMVPAFLRIYCGVNEILVSLMLVYVAQLLLSYAVYGPLKDPDGYGFPTSALFSDSTLLPVLLEDTRLYASIFLLPLAVLLVALLLRRSKVGFQMQVSGIEPSAARFAGFSTARPVWLCFLISGAFAGVMGMVEVAGPFGQLTEVISPGYGFTAIIVAFLGRLSPLAIVAAALLVALIYIGGENAQIEMQLPPSISNIFQALILFSLLAVDFFIHHRVTWGRAK